MEGRLSLRDRPVVPALLAIPGIALPFVYLFTFTDELLPVLLIPFLAYGAAVLLLIPIIFATLLLRRPLQHRIWGILLTIWWSLESIYLGVGAVSSLSAASALYGSSNQFPFSWSTLSPFPPLLGLVGGVWATVWHTSMTRMDLARQIIGPAGRVMLGGLIIFFSMSFIPGFTLFLVPAIGLLFSSMVLFFAPRMGRVLGVVVLVVCVFVGVLLPGQIQDLGGYPINSYYGFGAAIAVLVAGAVVAGSGGVASIKRKRSPRQQQPKPAPAQGEEQNRMWELPSRGA